jgi:DNA-dependent metalloprotease WSS1
MTHGPLFWKTYNILRKEMAELDSKGYTGEGFYSRAYSLTSTIPTTRPVSENEVPETICGGSWQRTKRRVVRRRKTGGRKRKFKGEGTKLGEDEGKRRQLESGKVASRVCVLDFLLFFFGGG